MYITDLIFRTDYYNKLYRNRKKILKKKDDLSKLGRTEIGPNLTLDQIHTDNSFSVYMKNRFLLPQEHFIFYQVFYSN